MSNPELGVYPKKFEKWVRTKDGVKVFLRPIKPNDAELWVELYNSLSSMSKYYRFFSSHRQPTPQMIKKYTDIDYVNNMAIVAIVNENGKDRMVGVARYVLDPPPDEAELAVVVTDDWQNRGLGTQMLLHILGIMIKRKIKKVHGDVFLENRKMLQLMHESGFKQIEKEDAFGVRHFVLKLQ
ncbi:MAG: GNAT family N-acetyltransferase [Candidatus Helarchaeota archaeon]